MSRNDPADLKQLQELCLRLLSIRDHSQKELVTKLSLRGYPREAILAVVGKLEQQGWQNDQRYAESFARSRIQKGYGPLRIIQELKQNGIDFIDLDHALAELQTDWPELLEQVYRKKYKQSPVTDRNEWAKRSRFLLQRGFPGELVGALFEQLSTHKNF